MIDEGDPEWWQRRINCRDRPRNATHGALDAGN